MELYPCGLLPSGFPLLPDFAEASDFAATPAKSGLAADPVLPPVGSDAPLSDCDVDFLERVLRDCHLGEAVAQQDVPAHQPAASALFPGLGGLTSSSGVGPVVAGSSVVDPWATALVHRLQGCQSPEEAHRHCAELLQSFAGGHPAGQPNTSGVAAVQMESRMQKLQGANSVLLRGFRSLYQKQREAEARRQRAEEAATQLAAELARTREQLVASERAKGALQYHLKLQGTGGSGGATAGGF